MRHDFKDGREADEKVDERFDHRHRAEEHVDEVPTAAHEAAKADESPVEAADDDKDPRDHVH